MPAQLIGPGGLEAIVALLADRPCTLTLQRIAHTALSGHRLVVPNGNGEVVYGDNTDPSQLNRPVWLTTDAWDIDSTARLVAYGVVDEPSWAWIPDGVIFLGVNGALTQTPPTEDDGAAFLVRVAVALTPTSIFYDPAQPIAFVPVGGYSDVYSDTYVGTPGENYAFRYTDTY